MAATTLTGDGSGITGVSASSLKSDDITEGDAAVTISTSTGAINLTPATGSAVVLDGSVNVDGGAVTGATTITASGAITGGSVTDGTATMSSGALSGVTTITGSGLATVGSLDVDDVLVDGATIGHTDDTDLVTLSNGTVTVAGTLAATTLTGDGSGITGVSASSLKSDDITEGDAAVTISTSTGAINLTPATGSAVVLDGSVNVDGGAVTGATTITASGAITGGSVTDGTATMSSGALSGVTTITGSGLATVGSLDVDDVLVDGATIGHTDDTDLVTLSNGTVTVAGTLAATTLTGDGSGITGVSASSLKSDDITEGDAAVTISTSTGAINLTPATGSAVVLDGSVNVDGGAVTGATTITASGAITGGSVTDGTATMSSGALSGVTTITGSGLATVGSLDVDDVLVDGATIGHTDDTDLVTLSNGTVTVAGTLAATTLTGDGSGITGVSASSLKSDDITEGDAAVTISTSTGAINLTPATGSAVVLDGSVNVDGGAVTGATTITASGAITGGSVTDGTATMSSGALSGVTTITGSGLATVGSLDVDDVLVDGATIGHTDDTDLVTLSNGTVTVAGEITATTLDIGGTNITATATEINVLDGALKENNSIWIGNDPSSTTNNALRNIGLGVTALDAITTGDNNVAIGYDALTENTTGSENMGVGYNALKVNVGGSGNSAIGSGSLASNTGGDFNTAVGSNSLNENIGGDKNVAIGNSSLRDNTSGNNNTSVGKSSSQLITTGDDNVALGYQAGNVLTTGNKNVIIGSDSDPSALDGTNQIVIGYGTTGKGNNTVTIGDGDITNWTPTDDGEVDLGSSSVEFKDIYIDGVAYTDAIGFGSTAMTLPSADGTSGQVLVTDGSGVLSWSSNAGSANRATTVTITDNEDTNENNALVFTSGGDVDGGNLGLESDGTATYNPSTGIITATGFNGNLTGTLQTAAQTNITSVGTLSSLTVSGAMQGGSVTDGTATMSSGALSGVTTITGSGLATVGSLDVDDVLVDGATIGHTDDTDLVTLSNGTVTVAGEITATTLDIGGTNITATATEINVLDGALKENNSIWIGNDPSSTTDNALNSVAFGKTALDAITTGDYNTAFGYDALTNQTTGNNNVAIGYEALRDNSTTSQNVAIGMSALQESNAAGNVAIGANAMRGTTNTAITGGENVAVGSSALKLNIGGASNTAIGKASMGNNTDGNYNVAVGKGSLNDNTEGSNNTTVGYLSANTGTNDITTGENNTLIGASTAASAAAGTNQTVIGYGSSGQANNSVTLGNADVTAVYMAQDAGATVYAAGMVLGGTSVTSTAAEINIIDGGTSATSTTIVAADRVVLNDDGTMKQVAMSDVATYVGSISSLESLYDAKSGGTNFTESLLIGHETTGTLNASEYNTGVGRGSLDALTEGDNNTALGYNSLSANTTGSDNIAIGYNALVANTTKGQNIAIGRDALKVQTDGGEFNVAVGTYSLDENTFGDKNVALGYVALGKNTEASYNTGIGTESLKLNTTGTNNTGLGYAAGDVVSTGSQNVLIGASTDPSAADATNQTVVGYGATGQADNSVTSR